jgi:hypothetical protein
VDLQRIKPKKFQRYIAGDAAAMPTREEAA